MFDKIYWDLNPAFYLAMMDDSNRFCDKYNAFFLTVDAMYCGNPL